MRSALLPWILLVLVVAAWVGTALLGREGTSEGPDADLREAAREAGAPVERREAPTLQGAPDAAAPTAPPPRKADDGEQAAARERSQRASAQSRAWYEALRSLADKRDRERALAEIHDGFTSSDPVLRLAALRAARWMGGVEYDHDAFRAAILPHTRSQDPAERRAAREAVGAVKAMPEDLPMWVEEAQNATRSDAEETARFIVKTAGGHLEGEAADAILHLLRDGTNLSRSMVVRGLQQARSFDPRLEARLIEVARGADGKGSDATGYFYHFLGGHFDPMSDAMLDMILDHAAAGVDVSNAVRALRRGLSDAQKAKAAARLTTLAENAGTTHDRRAVLEGFQHLRGYGDPERLEALANDENADRACRNLAATAAAAARRR